MTDGELDELLDGIAPVIRNHVTAAFADLQKQVEAIDAKAAVPGPGVSSLLISADGRLVAHLTDGRSLDVGPLPVKDGAPGADGRDADPARLQALESELSSLRSELAAKQADIDGLKASALTRDDLQVLIEAAREKWIAGLPQPRDGQDGKSVSIEDVAPLITAEVQKAAAAMPVPRDGIDGKDGRDGQDGHSVELTDVAPLVLAEVKASVAALPVPKDGEPGAAGASVTIDDVAPLIAAEVQKLVSTIPVARDGIDGKSVELVVVDDMVRRHVGQAVAALPPTRDGADGASVTLEDVAPLIVSEVQKAAALIPAGKDGATGADGKSVTVEDVTSLVAEVVTKAVAAIPMPKDGRDGVGVFGALIDRAGHLMLTLSDGSAKDLGPVVGKDVDVYAVEQLILSEVAKIPVPKDGAPGKDGRDGIGFDDLDLVSDDRGVFLRFVRGDVTKEFRLPVVVDRGVFSEGRTYGKGDGVTWGGSFWIAQADTTGKPGAGATGWRLAVKEGRVGKEGKPGLDGKPGTAGRDGLDLRSRV